MLKGIDALIHDLLMWKRIAEQKEVELKNGIKTETKTISGIDG